MAGEWPHLKIEEVAEKVAMGPFGSSIKVSTFVPTGIPVISGQHLHGTRLQDTEYNFITPEHAEKLKNANVYRGDVIFTHAGNIGQAAYIPPDSRYERYVISQRQFYMRCDVAKIRPSFVAYFVRTHEGQHKLLANSSPSGVPSIAQPVTYLRTIEIPVPPLPVQDAIASILGALDDKIDLNRRMNGTLEETARVLFKSWFVDFDPVRARAEGRDPGLPPEIGNLFPDSFQDSDLGDIPRGWKPATLGSISENTRAGVQPGEIERNTPYIGLEHMPRRSIALSEWGVADEVESNKFKFKRGEILFGKLRPYFHKVGVAPVDGVCSTDILVIAPQVPQWFGLLLCHVSSVEFINHTNAGSTGTKMPRTNWDEMQRYGLVLPPEDLANAFGERIRPMIERILAGIHESRTLAAIRDLLLPKLISGELAIPDAERIVGRAI